MPYEVKSITHKPLAHIAAFGGGFFQPRTLFYPEPEGGEGGGAGGDPAKNDGRMTAVEWAEVEKARASKLAHEKLVDELVKVKGENYDLRRKVAPEGGRVLSKAEAERYEAYQKLGKPEEITASLTERDSLKADKVKSDWQKSVSDAAKAANMRANVLEKLLSEGSVLEVKSVTADGKTLEVAYVKDTEGKEYKLADYMEAQHKDFLPALMEEPAKGEPARKWIPSAAPSTAEGKPASNPIADAVKGAGPEAGKEVSLFSKD